MDKETGLAALRYILDSGISSKSMISNEFNIHPSQVSRIAAGKFKRMDGHALKVCKFAHFIQKKEKISFKQKKLLTDLDAKVAQLISISPHTAEALAIMLDALINDLSETSL